MEPKMLLDLRPPRQRARYVDEIGPVVCMVVRDRYVMVRRPRAMPFVISLAEWHKNAGTKPTEKPLHATDKLILKALADEGELTNPDLQVRLGLVERTVRERLRRLREAKIIYVCRWIEPQGTGKHRAVYALGNKKSAPEPKLDRKKANDKYRKKMRLVINAKARKNPPNPFQQLLTQ
jgi:DNA-binding transcriptional ArsR family regulator